MSTPRARVRSPIILQTNKNNCSYPLHIHDLLISSIRMHLDTNSVCLGSSTGASVDAFLKHNEYQFFLLVWYLCTVCTHISYLDFAFCPWAAVVGFVVPAFRATSRRFCVVLEHLHRLFKRLCIWKNIDQSSIICANWFGYPHLPSPSAGVPTAVHMETSQYLWRRRVENPFATYAHRLAMCTITYAHPSFPRWTCHAGCAYAYANFAQPVQISKFCTFEAATVHLFSIRTGFFIRWTCVFHDTVQIVHKHSHRWRWSKYSVSA